MDFKLFFLGLGFLLAAVLMYYYIRGVKPSSEKTNWEGPTIMTYIQCWGAIILCIMCGIGFIIKALPAQI